MRGNMEYTSEETADSNSWEEFFGSSLELGPALLSIYDSIAANTSINVVDNKGGKSDDDLVKTGDNHKVDTTGDNRKLIKTGDGCNIDTTGDNLEVKTNDNRNIKTGDNDNVNKNGDNHNADTNDENDNIDDNGENTIIENGGNKHKMASNSEPQNRKKRPLSISSMSSSSTSSLSLPIRKRLNDQGSSCDSEAANENFGEKLEHLLYIDDDTDQEMSIDCNKSQNSPKDQSQCVSSPQNDASPSDSCAPRQKYVSYSHRVVTEIIETERTYINHLKEILEGYLYFIRDTNLRISEENISSLFGNIEDIYKFGRMFLQQLEMCGDDPVQVAQCFVKNNDGFKIYAEYCTNYPSAVEVLTMIMKDPELNRVFRHQQGCLNHSLPLGSYLLKPVQRILKYHLLLQNIIKNYDKSDPAHVVLTQAFDHMTSMAHHINEMKRKHEHAVRVQEIQSQLEDYEGEDLTQLGELVLEGSFRIYGAKTSRQVFLFEKAVLIGKRKEDGMLNCRVIIQCSNLMLVESVPKEPLSFQVIPFDNPRGQHTLQARTLEQKRKWCQEIKRLLIESYKGKIPDKVKGLVMQLGKSRDEESAKSSSLDIHKISYHNAPEYLEKRQRMRRKSGTLLSDLLKPQRIRRGQRRAESVSPRSSPPPERRVHPSPSTPRGFFIGDKDATPSTPVPKVTKVAGRSISFRQAVGRQPLRSVDFGTTMENKENNSQHVVTPTSAKRSKSFKMATKLNPVLSASSGQLNQDSSKSCSLTRMSSQGSSDQLDSTEVKHDNHRLLTRFNSMPVLNVLEPGITNLATGKSIPSNKSLNQKKIFDTKQYFQRSGNGDLRMGRNSVSAQRSGNGDLRMGRNSVSAFHDNFLKKSTESISQKLGPIKLTKPKPFSPSSPKHHVMKSFSIGCKPIDDPWERKTNLPNVHHRTRSDQDIDQMDWLVYTNRNSLPLDGFNLGPKLLQHCKSSESANEIAHAQMKSTGDCSHEFSKSENCLDDHMNREFPNYCLYDHMNKEFPNYCLDDHMNREFPNFGALPVVKVNRPQTRLNRSNSTNSQPLSRVDRHQPRHCSTSVLVSRVNRHPSRHCSTSVLETHDIKDHEQIIAEMEDYMKQSESSSVVSSVKFPSDVIHQQPEENRPSSSNSSYDTPPNSPQTLHKSDGVKQFDRRSGSYDNRATSDNEAECDKSKRYSLNKRDQSDLQSVLHAGDLGGAFIGQRIAESDPTYAELPKNSQYTNHTQTCLLIDHGTSRLPSNHETSSVVDFLQNESEIPGNSLQSCDSAVSIRSNVTCDEDSPRSDTPVNRIPSGDSLYERQLSVAFDDGEILRDSAVYCEMDPQEHIKGDSKLHAQIKTLVKKLEEKSKHIQPSVTKVKQREPGTIIKQRLESLQGSASRPHSIERELRFYSRPGSVERDSIANYSRPGSVERDSISTYSRPTSVDKDSTSLSTKSRPMERDLISRDLRKSRSVSADREILSSFKPSRPLRCTSECRYSDEMSSSYSANRLDQLTTDLNNLIVMRGWVKQLIDKFQSKK